MLYRSALGSINHKATSIKDVYNNKACFLEHIEPIVEKALMNFAPKLQELVYNDDY